MKLKSLLFIAFVGFGLSTFAKEVPKSIAELIAKNFYYQGVNSLENKNVDYGKINLKLELLETKDAESTYYVFNVNYNEGFVLISAEDKVKPVLAYSFKGSFNKNNIAPAMTEMLEWYKAQISYAAKNKIDKRENIEKQWVELVNFSPEKGAKQMRNVSPLILSNWSQGYPYNIQCPADAQSYDGHVPVGCVATAMVQVMKYYDYPYYGTGHNNHFSSNNGGYGTLYANFGNTFYNWEGMPLIANGENDDLALINFHAGIAVEMEYGPNGSGTQSEKVVSALRDHFKYDHSITHIYKYSYAESTYINMLKAQINAGKPMVYSGQAQSIFGPGHAWVCDGYMNNEFHMNWGWGGSGDGYFTLDNLMSQGTAGGSSYNFIYNQGAVVNIYPEANYPRHCSGTKAINAQQGSFGDGSADDYYNNNQTCYYNISPSCGSSIKLTFDMFELGNGDVVNIYDGSSTANPLLDSFDASNPPNSTQVRGSKTNMLIEFITDGSSMGKGWYASFNTDFCTSNMTYTDAGGTVSDGSGICDYQKSSFCTYLIQPQGASTVALDFLEFDLGGNIDYLKVFENNSSGNLVGTFDANNTPTQLTVNAPTAFLQFWADSDNSVGSGWTLNYGTMVDVKEETVLTGIELYPNPASDIVNLAFSLDDNQTVNIKIVDITGRFIAKQEINGIKGYQTVKLNEIMKMPKEEGIYMIELEADGRTVTKRLSLTN